MKNMKWILGICFTFGGAALAAGTPAKVRRAEAWRAAWMASLLGPGAEAPREKDRAEDVVDALAWRKLGDIEAAGAMHAELAEKPWSGSYWPHYAGSVAYRYADPGMKKSKDWSVNERYVVDNLGRGFPGEPSPAEKYDRLVGDRRFGLTRWALARGRSFYEESGSVEAWMGLCHGWAPAAAMVSRPRRAVEVKAADGTPILFYPADVQALATLLWGEGKFPSKLIGGRCRDKAPGRGEDGRPKNPDCLDNNPATWHLALVNQLGHGRRPLLFDASADYEVWNFPIYAYSLSYVAEGSGAETRKWEEAARALTEADRSRAPRAEGATKIVRVRSEASYVIPRDPDASLESEPADDRQAVARYDYELELNDDGDILGGEWLGKDHPDFLWVPAKDARVATDADALLDKEGDQGEWRGEGALPERWRELAPEASGKGLPLRRIIDELVRRSE